MGTILRFVKKDGSVDYLTSPVSSAITDMSHIEEIYGKVGMADYILKNWDMSQTPKKTLEEAFEHVSSPVEIVTYKE